MDPYHRKLDGKDTRIGRDCEFCFYTDPNFAKRNHMDRMVVSKLGDTGAAHLTEDGYVKHRIAELLKKRAAGYVETGLAKSA
jgi:hypothetical protein